MGKGSRRRPTNMNNYRDTWEGIFGKKKTGEELAEEEQWLKEINDAIEIETAELHALEALSATKEHISADAHELDIEEEKQLRAILDDGMPVYVFVCEDYRSAIAITCNGDKIKTSYKILDIIRQEGGPLPRVEDIPSHVFEWLDGDEETK